MKSVPINFFDDVNDQNITIARYAFLTMILFGKNNECAVLKGHNEGHGWHWGAFVVINLDVPGIPGNCTLPVPPLPVPPFPAPSPPTDNYFLYIGVPIIVVIVVVVVVVMVLCRRNSGYVQI